MSNGFIPPDIVGYEQQQRTGAQQVRNRASVTERNRGEAAGLSDSPSASSVGGGGRRRANPLDRYTRVLQKMLTGGSYRQPYDELTNRLNTMGTQAQGTINSSMDQLQNFLQGQANPYEGFRAQQTQVSPELSNFLQSQGVSTDPLRQFAATINQQNAGQATAFQNMADSLKNLYTTQQQGMIGDVAQQRANLSSALGAAQTGMGAQVNQQALGQRNELMQMLLQALGQGGQPRSGRLM